MEKTCVYRDSNVCDLIGRELAVPSDLLLLFYDKSDISMTNQCERSQREKELGNV